MRPTRTFTYVSHVAAVLQVEALANTCSSRLRGEKKNNISEGKRKHLTGVRLHLPL